MRGISCYLEKKIIESNVDISEISNQLAELSDTLVDIRDTSAEIGGKLVRIISSKSL